MTDKLQQTIKEELAKLPQENQNAINALDWVKITEEIGKKNLLTESEINDLQVETLLIMVDLEDPKAYANNIENNIDTSKEEAEKIAGEVTEKIFIPINNILVEKIKKSEPFTLEEKHFLSQLYRELDFLEDDFKSPK